MRKFKECGLIQLELLAAAVVYHPKFFKVDDPESKELQYLLNDLDEEIIIKEGK